VLEPNIGAGRRRVPRRAPRPARHRHRG
jgi:hypothetical protein